MSSEDQRLAETSVVSDASAVVPSQSQRGKHLESFCEQVASRLRRVQRSTAMNSDEYDSWFAEDYANPPVYAPTFMKMPAENRVDSATLMSLNVERRLANVEQTQDQILTLLQRLSYRLDQMCLSSSSLSPGLASPGPFSFSCPLCQAIQHSPKSHCEHMRKMAQGKSECVLNAGNDVHSAILRTFKSPECFAQWSVYLSNERECMWLLIT
jgi:hypothetical protein